MRVFKRYCMLLISVGLVFSMFACVVNPYDGKYVTSHSPILFSGYVPTAEANVDILAYNKATSSWDVLATAVSTDAPTTIAGDTLYAFSTNLDLATITDWKCYWDATCAFLHEGTFEAEFKVRSGSYFMTTFEQGGLTCVLQNIQAGQSWLEAGYNCKGSNSPVLILKIAYVE